MDQKRIKHSTKMHDFITLLIRNQRQLATYPLSQESRTDL